MYEYGIYSNDFMKYKNKIYYTQHNGTTLIFKTVGTTHQKIPHNYTIVN